MSDFASAFVSGKEHMILLQGPFVTLKKTKLVVV